MADVVGLTALQKRLSAISGPRMNERILATIGMATVREAKLTVARKTGNLGRSIHAEPPIGSAVVVRASARYAAYVELGTRAHEITPNVKKALRFASSASGRRLSGSPRVGAAVTFAKRVHHPGTKAQPYLLPAARKVVDEVGTSEVVKSWNGAA